MKTTQTSQHGTASPRAIVIGNWKMNGFKGALSEALKVSAALTAEGAAFRAATDVMLCPPTTLTLAMSEALRGSQVTVGGQDCHAQANGAHTGDISAEMLRDAGATAVIVGHSERRSTHGERDQDVRAKGMAAHRAGLLAIICVGETAGERATKLTHQVIRRQLSGSIPDSLTPANTIIAYEPIWAIGSGLTPSAQDVAEVHAGIVGVLEVKMGQAASGVRLLYGGSVKPSNAKELMSLPNVHGALVGGASLTAADFLGIISAYLPRTG